VSSANQTTPDSRVNQGVHADIAGPDKIEACRAQSPSATDPEGIMLHGEVVYAAVCKYPPAEPGASVVTLKAAIRGHFKTGHRDWPET